MGLRYAAGQHVNLLERALTVTMTPPPDTGYPIANLWDGRPARLVRHNSNAADPSITADLAAFDGGMGGWIGGVPAGWTKVTTGTGTFIETTTVGEYVTSPAAKGNPGTGTAQQSRDIIVRAGERRRISISMRRAGSGTGRLSVQNLYTKKFLAAAGASWSAAQAFVLSDNTNTTHTTQAADYTVEDMAACQSPIVRLRLTLDAGGTGDSMYDDVADWPRWNALEVHGHNLDPGLVVELRSSTDGFVGSNVLQQTGAILQPSFFIAAPATVNHRHVRLQLTGTNQEAAWYGEVVPCFLETALKAQNWNFEVRYKEDQIRNQGRLGITHVSNLAPIFRRLLKMSFEQTVTEEAELRHEIVWRCRGGAYPLLVVPIEGETMVLYIRLDDSWAVVREFTSHFLDDLTGSEDPVAAPLA
jgi:hypothetical protein